MSQYNTGHQFSANDAGWDAFDPRLAPFLSTMDQSEAWNQPASAATRQPVGSTAALPPNTESVSLHAKAGFTGVGIKRVPHTCAACSALFPRNNQLERHAAENNHKAYLCTCGKAFTRASALRRHIEEFTQARKHDCPLCDHKFKRSGHVEQHLRLAHKKPGDVIKDLLAAQTSKPLEGRNQASTSSVAGPTAGFTNTQAGYPVVLTGGPWTESTGFHPTFPVDNPVSQPGHFSGLAFGLPDPGTESVAEAPAFMPRGFVAQAAEFHVFPAGAEAATQIRFTGNFAPDLAGDPARHPDENLSLLEPNLASVTVGPADDFSMPALENDFMEAFYDVDLDVFGL